LTNENKETPSKSIINTIFDNLVQRPSLESEVNNSLWHRSGVFLDNLFLKVVNKESVLGISSQGPVNWKTDFTDQKDVQNVSRNVLLMSNYILGVSGNSVFPEVALALSVYNNNFKTENSQSEDEFVGALSTINEYLSSGKNHAKVSNAVDIINDLSKKLIKQDKIRLTPVLLSHLYTNRAEKIFNAYINLESEGIKTYLTSGEYISFEGKGDNVEDYYTPEMIERHDVLENELVELYDLMGEKIPDSIQTIIDSKLFLMYQGILKSGKYKEKEEYFFMKLPILYRSIVSNILQNPIIENSYDIIDLAIKFAEKNYDWTKKILEEERLKTFDELENFGKLYLRSDFKLNICKARLQKIFGPKI